MKSVLTLTMNPVVDKSVGVDRVLPERKLRCGVPHYNPGGGGINVSRAIKKLGGDSLAICPLGGTTGQLFESLLRREGVRHTAVPIEGMTRENLIVTEEDTGQQFRFGMPGPPLKEDEWQRCLDEISKVSPVPDYIVASGSLPPNVPEDFYAQVARIARQKGSSLILDTTSEPLRRAVQEGLYMIKPNIREAQELVGPDSKYEYQLEAAAKELVDKGWCQVVVVSLGAAGALAVWKDNCRHLRTPAVPVKSKIGAGDSTVAGIVLSLARGDPLSEALRFGVACGAAAVMTAASELSRKEDAERLYRRAVSEACNPYSPV